jgi:hypothetical protein
MRRMILAVLVAASLSVVTFADETPPAAPASPEAVEAQKKHDSAIKEAREKLYKAIIAADQQYVADLKAALKAAMLNQDIDSARALDDQMKAAEAILKRDQAAFDTASGQGRFALVGATAKQGATSLSLPPGASVYIYGMATGGARDCRRFEDGSVVSVKDGSGYLSAQLAVTSRPENQFSTDCVAYVIGGCGVSNGGSLTALYGANEAPGASSASVDFTLDGPATVVVVGLASGQQAISFDGVPDLHIDVPANGSEAMAIAHADLAPGKYTIRELTVALLPGQDAINQADLMGVFIFSAGAIDVSSRSSKIAIPENFAAPRGPAPERYEGG